MGLLETIKAFSFVLTVLGGWRRVAAARKHGREVIRRDD
jgi:hypothetical protein